MSRKAWSDADKAKYYKAKYAAAAKSGSPKASSYQAKYKAAKPVKVSAASKPRSRGPGFISEGGGMLGAAAGGALGGPAGAAIGKMLGGKLGHIIENITGFGDYSVQSNSIMTGMMQPAQVVNSVDRGSFIVRHREYIGDVKATSAFTVTSYPINPGRPETFPWLSTVAQAFEQYRMRGCLFEFLSTSSDALLMASSSSSLGTVNMATEYDSLENNFSSKREMLNHEFANSRKPSVSFIHPIECKKNRTAINEQYVRTISALPANADLRLYDLGKFQIATEGMQSATGVCGELWVTYEIELFKAKYDSAYVNDGSTDHWKLPALTNLLPLGTFPTLMPGSTLNGTIAPSGNVYTFPSTVAPGDQFLVNWTMSALNTAVVSFPAITLVGLQGVSFYGNPSTQASVYTPTAGSTTSSCNMTIMLRVTAANPTITWGLAGTLPATNSYGDLVITQVQTDLSFMSKEIETDTNNQSKVVELEETPSETREYIRQLEEQVGRLRRLERKPTV